MDVLIPPVVAIVLFWISYRIQLRWDLEKRVDDRYEQLRIKTLQFYKYHQVAGRLSRILKASDKKVKAYDMKKGIRLLVGSAALAIIAYGYLPRVYSGVVISIALAVFFYHFSNVMRIAQRTKRIKRELSPVLDLCVICMGAGLGLIATFERIGLEMKDSAIGSELHQVVNETSTGIPLEESLRHMMARVNIQELSAVLSAIIQAEKIGSSLIETFKVQSVTLREKIRLETREKMAKLPTYLIPPMVIFLVPPIIVMVVGPPLVELIQVFATSI